MRGTTAARRTTLLSPVQTHKHQRLLFSENVLDEVLRGTGEQRTKDWIPPDLEGRNQETENLTRKTKSSTLPGKNQNLNLL